MLISDISNGIRPSLVLSQTLVAFGAESGGVRLLVGPWSLREVRLWPVMFRGK